MPIVVHTGYELADKWTRRETEGGALAMPWIMHE